MAGSEKNVLTNDQKSKIKELLLTIFRDICFNSSNVLRAKEESDQVSDKIRKFILSYVETNKPVDEVNLFLKAKDMGLQLVESHELIFFDEDIDPILKMRAFLIPGMKIDLTEENASDKVTEDDLQTIDHELCISFKKDDINDFTKLGNLLDIRANLAKPLGQTSQDKKEVEGIISESKLFAKCLEMVLDSARSVISEKDT